MLSKYRVRLLFIVVTVEKWGRKRNIVFLIT